MSQSIPGKPVSLHYLDFQAKDRLTPRWHMGQPCGKASWEGLVGKLLFLYEVSFHLHSAIANVAKIQMMDALNDTLEKVSHG